MNVQAPKESPIPSLTVKHSYCGATYVFDSIGESLGITSDLKACFPENYKQILSIAYFLILEDQNTPIRGIKVIPKEKVIAQAEKDYGYFVLISNEIKDPILALETFRNKDLVEKLFGNLKERLNLLRTAVSLESSLEGKLFVQFVASIYLSHIKNAYISSSDIGRVKNSPVFVCMKFKVRLIKSMISKEIEQISLTLRPSCEANRSIK